MGASDLLESWSEARVGVIAASSAIRVRSARFIIQHSNRYVKTSKGLLAASSRCAFAVTASSDVPPKGVIVEADSLGTDTGNVALLAEGLVQAGDETIKESSSTSLRRPGIRGYSFAREEESCTDTGQYGCTSNEDCLCDCCVAYLRTAVGHCSNFQPLCMQDMENK